MLWPHTKTLIPTEAGYEFFAEMLKPPFANHTVAFTTNSVPYIITPPLSIKKLQDLCPQEDQNPQMPAHSTLRLCSGQAFFRSGQDLLRHKLQ